MDRRFSDFYRRLHFSHGAKVRFAARGRGRGGVLVHDGKGPIGACVCVHMIGVKRSFRQRNEEIEGGDCAYHG